ncbi:hypothetical protein KCU98_g16084, partial [Aureobasidium melanogenum]
MRNISSISAFALLLVSAVAGSVSPADTTEIERVVECNPETGLCNVELVDRAVTSTKHSSSSSTHKTTSTKKSSSTKKS